MQHGNGDTFDDYLRIKRTVQLRYAVVDPIMQERVKEEEVMKADAEMTEVKEVEKVEEGKKQVV